MKNNIYRLVEPGKITVEQEDLDTNTHKVIVRPTHLSICHADQRYYQGDRSPEILAKKLPMALIHEGIGIVEQDRTGHFCKGQTVVMVPNTPIEEDEIIAENYLRSSKFRASGYDGFLQTYVSFEPDRLIAIPEDLDRNVAAFTEIVAVAYHAINRFCKIAHKRRNTIGVWGEGNLGYIISLLLKERLPQSKLIVFGVKEDKLKEFSFADATYTIDNIPQDIKIDHAFECVGKEGSEIAINQIINEFTHPEATISILGVSEQTVAINTRMILEKGLIILGNSRCGAKDFKDTIDLYIKNPRIPLLLKAIIGAVVNLKSIEDIHKAFSLDIENRSRKTILEWNIDN